MCITEWCPSVSDGVKFWRNSPFQGRDYINGFLHNRLEKRSLGLIGTLFILLKYYTLKLPNHDILKDRFQLKIWHMQC